MGLDMYAYTIGTDGEREELAYWRKHNRLHGWMEDLYREKGGTEEFNCVSVELTAEDIDRLEKAVEGKNLPATQGFFFGSDSYAWEDGYDKEDKAFIEVARQTLADGKKVFYDSWW